MGISIYNIKKWTRMITGKSIEHVNQDVGKIYSLIEIKGYYNDLTEKVTKDPNFNEIKLPILRTESGSDILFPISIFQFGLGAYDLLLMKEEKIFGEKFKICVDWAYENQLSNGSWSNFFHDQPNAPYSSMAQGEGASLLIRAYVEFNEERYLTAAKKAINFMLIPLEDGGTTIYSNDDIFFQEFTNKPTVLNGWIFSLFGLYDYIKIVYDERLMNIYNCSIKTMVKHIGEFDNGYWSKYDNVNMITSPFYHKLHIAQLKVMYDITGESIFLEYAEKWSAYNNNTLNRLSAFIVKVGQKLVEK
jgi:heparosan-N-sulfate-glucuronate 5-epimerase